MVTRKVVAATGSVIVDHENAVSAGDQPISHMRANKSSSSRHQDTHHAGLPTASSAAKENSAERS